MSVRRIYVMFVLWALTFFVPYFGFRAHLNSTTITWIIVVMGTLSLCVVWWTMESKYYPPRREIKVESKKNQGGSF